MRAPSPRSLSADSAAMVCIRVSPVPPDFEIATKRVVPCGSFSSNASKRDRIEIVHEMDARRLAQRRRRPGRVAGKLRQRLAAEARAAGAEKHDVGRAGRDEPLRRLACIAGMSSCRPA